MMNLSYAHSSADTTIRGLVSEIRKAYEDGTHKSYTQDPRVSSPRLKPGPLFIY